MGCCQILVCVRGAAEYEVGSSRHDWDGDVGSWTESEGTSSSEKCQHNVERFLSSWKIGNLRGWL